MGKDFMEQAIDLAYENVQSGNGGPFGAIIVKDNKIISKGTNLVTSTNDPTAHAEVVAIRRACEHLGDFSLKDCTIYTSCEPCPMCLSAIYWARIDKIYYAGTKHDAARIGFDDDFIYKELEKQWKSRSIETDQILNGEVQKVFESWVENDSKIPY